jgi:hypothetical protein
MFGDNEKPNEGVPEVEQIASTTGGTEVEGEATEDDEPVTTISGNTISEPGREIPVEADGKGAEAISEPES